MMLYVLVALLMVALITAFIIRATWAVSLPGLLLLVLIFWLLFGT